MRHCSLDGSIAGTRSHHEYLLSKQAEHRYRQFLEGNHKNEHNAFARLRTFLGTDPYCYPDRLMDESDRDSDIIYDRVCDCRRNVQYQCL